MSTFAFLADPSSGCLLQPIPTKANLGHIPGEIGLEVSYKIMRFEGSSTGPSAKQVVMFAGYQRPKWVLYEPPTQGF
jgi:hypothetical protein